MGSTSIDFFPSNYNNEEEGGNAQFNNQYKSAPVYGNMNNMNMHSGPTSFEDEPPLWEGKHICFQLVCFNQNRQKTSR